MLYYIGSQIYAHYQYILVLIKEGSKLKLSQHQVRKIIFKYQSVPICHRVEACRHPNVVIYTVQILRTIWYQIWIKYQPPGMA